MGIGAAIAGGVASAAASKMLADDSSGAPARAEDVTPAQFRRLRDPISQSLQDILQSGGGPQFGGDFTAGMTDQEAQFLQSIGQQGQPSQASQAGQNVLNQTLQGDFLSPDSNPFLAQTIEAAQRPVVQQFQDVTMPRLRSQFTQAGQRIQADPRSPNEGQSSPFDRAAALATRGMTQELGDISAQIAGQNFQAERGRQMDAAQLAPQIDQAQLQQAIQGMEASALPRLIEQQGIDRGLAEFRRRTDALLNALQIGGSIASPQTVTFEGQPAAPGAGQAFASALAEGIGSGVSSRIANSGDS